MAEGNYRHGMYGTRTYKSWAEMKRRCGTRWWKNITYDPRWEDFTEFYKDMGERPEGTSLDRIDVRGNYCKQNCRWADTITQSNNRTSNKYYLINDELLTLNQIARKYNISRSNLANKIYLYHWDIHTAVNYLLEKGV